MLLRLCGTRFVSRTNVFLSGKAEIAIETRQVLIRASIWDVYVVDAVAVHTQGQRNTLSLS